MSEPTDPVAAEAGGDSLAGLASTRRSYLSGELIEDRLAPTWFAQLRSWFDQAIADERIGEPNAMQVATADAAGRPDLRTVLARGFDDAGVVFFTNYSSAKGRQLADNPVAAALFSWLPMERQIRLRGPVATIERAETARYFASRPRGAQLAAWASPQSEPIAGRAELERRLAEVTERFGDGEIAPPPHWGGYRITVTEAEFWQGREFRLHDRLRFRLDADAGSPARWVIERLGP